MRYPFLALLLLLQGCIYDRILQTKAQLCNQQPPQIVIEGSAPGSRSVVFNKPTLTLRDVVWLLGADPSARTERGSAVQLTYASVPLLEPPTVHNELVLELTFSKIGTDYKLQRARIPAQLEHILSPHLIDEAMRLVCRSKIYPASLRADFDLTGIDPSTLPTRHQILSVLDSPTAPESAPSLEYRYCLQPCAKNLQRPSSWKVAFDDQGRMRNATVEYLRYVLSVDLSSNKARIALRPWGSHARLR